MVVGYRRYYQWVPIIHFQIFRYKKADIPPINEFVSNGNRPSLLYTDNYLRHWKSLVGDDFNFLIYNMAEDQNIMRTLYYKMLYDTKNPCRKYNINDNQNIVKSGERVRTKAILWNISVW